MDVVQGFWKLLIGRVCEFPSKRSFHPVTSGSAIARALAAQRMHLYDERHDGRSRSCRTPLYLMLRLKHHLQLTSVIVNARPGTHEEGRDRVVFLFEGRVIYFGRLATWRAATILMSNEFLRMDRVEV
jgi:ABC-type transporter Mla maintaining outer membrane lipid asymmetry ATPase subunit MlaF